MSVAWYVSANNQMFGPYSFEQMRDYVQEQRLGPKSMVRMGEAGAFQAAERHIALSKFFERKEQAAAEAAAAVAAQPRQIVHASVPADDEPSNFVIIAELRTGSTRHFETELKKMGRTYRLNTTTWMLQAEKPINSVRLNLAPYVGREDHLIIIDARRNRFAFHNLGAVEAATIKELWKLPNEPQ
ncbi:MAG: DUF4339 domain-containing protein [Micropepsaceae bacterium]